MRVAFTGTSSTGKTTLARRVVGDPRNVIWGGEFITADARTVLRTLGHQSVDEMTPEERRAFQYKYLERKLATEADATHYVTDRSFIDVAAYWLEYNAGGIDDEFVAQCRRESARYQLHFYFPAGLIPLELDGYRSEDAISHARVDALIQKLAAQWETPLIRLSVLALEERATIFFDAVLPRP